MRTNPVCFSPTIWRPVVVLVWLGIFAPACGKTSTGIASDSGADSVPLDSAQSDTQAPGVDATDETSDGTDDTAVTDGSPDGPEGSTPGGYTLPSFAGGLDFPLSLPPSFSPFLPLHGNEVTREPPGFHDQTSDYYFSYGFLWWLTDMPDLSTAALHDDLVLYFTGLCPSTTVTATLDDPQPVHVDAGALVARRSGTLDATTCFMSPVPSATIEVSTTQCPDHTAVLVFLSPQPPTSQVWTDLHNIRDGFTCF